MFDRVLNAPLQTGRKKNPYLPTFLVLLITILMSIVGTINFQIRTIYPDSFETDAL